MYEDIRLPQITTKSQFENENNYCKFCHEQIPGSKNKNTQLEKLQMHLRFETISCMQDLLVSFEYVTQSPKYFFQVTAQGYLHQWPFFHSLPSSSRCLC